MAARSPARAAALATSALALCATVVFNAFAGSGKKGGPFQQSTGNVSAKYETDITPAGWTFSIWGVIYTWLCGVILYLLTGLCRRNAYGWVYCMPAVLPYGFFLSWTLNMIFNIVWLFLWDREQIVAGMIVLALIAFTNYLVIFFCCHGLHLYGAWLNKYHKVDLWAIRVLVLNGVGVYAAWTTIATLLNFSVVLEHSAGVSRPDAGTASLSLLLIEVITWFILENFVLERHVRYLLTVYPVVIVALIGSMTKHFDPAAPQCNSVFTAVLLAMACFLFVARILLVLLRHRKQPLYRGTNTEALVSPLEIAGKQKWFFN